MKNHLLFGISLLCFFLTPLAGLAQITDGMIDPKLEDPEEPFSYFWNPTDVIGTFLAPAASEVTPEGYIYTGFGELMFFTGNPPRPVNKRVKTLHSGHLPIVEYRLERDGVTYDFTLFAANLGGELSGLPVNFARVRVTNRAREQRAAFVTSAFRFQPPVATLTGLADYRFRQRMDLLPKEYVEGQDKFNPEWKHDFSSNSVTRDGRVLYWFPTSPEPFQLSLALREIGLRGVRFFTGEVSVGEGIFGLGKARHTLHPQLPIGVVAYRLILKPGEGQDLVFKMPIVPLPADSSLARTIEAAECEPQLEATVKFWNDLVVRKIPLKIPEEKVQQFLIANTIYDLLAIDKVGEDYIPNINQFQYHQFWASADTCFMMNALDLMGLSDVAGKAYLYSLTSQREDGAFPMPDGELRYCESFGWSLWGWGSHYQLTRDRDFLRKVYPGVVRAVAWQKSITSQDPLGLLPPPIGEIADDAYLKSARQTSAHIWVLIGLKNAIRLAEAMEKKDDAADFTAYYDRFRAAFEKLLAQQTEKSGGYIPPALDVTLEGNDWDNLHLLWPEPLFDPFDPRVTATIQQSRDRYVEGILTFVRPKNVLAKDSWPVTRKGVKGGGYTFQNKPMLHYWQTQNNSHNNLIRGGDDDQRLVVEDLYAQLLHTTAAHAPAEYGTYPWSSRDIEGAYIHDILPDGPASGKTVELIRNMIVCEYKKDLLLLPAVSPNWLAAGKKIEGENLPTEFGPLGLKVRADAGGWTVDLVHEFWEQPERVILTIPWFYKVDRVQIDGRAVQTTTGKVQVPVAARQIRVDGRIKQGTPTMSFDQAVTDYRQEYRRRYESFLRTGQAGP